MELFDLESLDSYDQAIPAPAAPVRPISSPVGQTIPVVTGGGITGHLDSSGNIWNDAQQWVGNLNATSLANIPGTPPATSSAPLTSAAAPKGGAPAKGALASLVTLENWAAGIVSRSSDSTGLSLEDIIFILLGLLLIAGSLFSFKETRDAVQNVRDTVSKGAAHAAELAA